ncbi:hypothetical protein [Streptomyces mirabilis]|nr:hypothetical protein [Streptomyces mirabilis]
MLTPASTMPATATPNATTNGTRLPARRATDGCGHPYGAAAGC